MIRRSTLRQCSEPTCAEFAFLHEAEQFHLHLEREVADFVEERRAAIGHLHQSLLVLDRAAERAL